MIPKKKNTKKQRKCAPQERTLTGEETALLKAEEGGWRNKSIRRARGGEGGGGGELVGERLSQTEKVRDTDIKG